MTAEIIPFPTLSKQEVITAVGKIGFDELIQLRANLIDHLFSLVQQNDQKARNVLSEVGGEAMVDQISILHQRYPYWQEWKEVKRKTSKLKKS